MSSITKGWETAPSILALGSATHRGVGYTAGTMARTAPLAEPVRGRGRVHGGVHLHRRAEPLANGERVAATVTPRVVDGRRYIFDVVAVHEHGQEPARGTHERRIILLRRFADGGSGQPHRTTT